MKLSGAFALGVLLLSGCERGCLATWLHERGIGGQPAGPRASARGIDLSGKDCPDGLLRCVEGRVEASRAAHVPDPCGPSQRQGQGEGKSACECPYEPVMHCAQGCAIEGVEVIAVSGSPLDAGAVQLCRAAVPVSRGIGPADVVAVEICAEQGFRCIDGIVRGCDRRGQPARAIARCVHGCQTLVSLDETDSVDGPHTSEPGSMANLDGVVSILCRHDDAERQ